MKKLFLFFFLAHFLSSHLSAQTQFQRTYGGVDSTQDGLDVKQTSDGGYIINARISSYAPPTPGLEDAYILKVNSTGILQWSKRHAGSSYEEGRTIVQTTDGGYYYAGETRTWSAGGPSDFDVFATKMDAAGNIQWTRNYGDVWSDAAWVGEQTTDGGYMAFGSSSNFATNGYADFYLLKLSNAGAIQWSRTFGGTYFDYGYDATQTADGGYIMTGSSFSFGSGYALYTIKADVNGTFQWGTALNGFADEYSYSVIQTNDGGYIVAGGTTGFGSGGSDVLLAKMTSSGSVSWMSTYGGFQNDCGFTVKQTSDGGYAVAGGTNSVGNGGYDLFLMKTNSAGALLWTKTYGGSADDGFTGGMFFTFSNVNADVSMVNTADGGFALTSQTNSFGGGHVYLIKTDSDGNSGCNETNGPFMQTVPTPSVIINGLQTNPVQLTGIPVPLITTPTSIDSNVCCVTPTATAGNDITICQSSSATLNGSGGGNYSWSPSAGLSNSTIANPVATPTSTTTYTLTVSDSCGTDTDVLTITVNPLPVANAGADATICPGDNVTLIGSGGGTYLWNPGGQTASAVSVNPTSTTTYTLTVTNSCGVDTDSATVTISNSITASVTGNTSICSGQTTTLTASGGTTYSWSTGATTNPVFVSPTSAATYSVIAYSGSCSDTASITVSITTTPVAAISGGTTICSGQSATLTASGGGNYSWSNSSTSSSLVVSPTSTSTYSVVVSNGSCTDTASATVTVSASPNASISGTTTICAGGSTLLLAAGGTMYSWNTGATTSSITVSPTTNTSYSVIASNGICTDTATVNVTVVSGVTAAASASSATFCAGSSVALSASGGNNYSWNTGSTASSIVVTSACVGGSVTTTYSVNVSIGSCSDDASVTVTAFCSPFISISGNTPICSGQTATLTATGGSSYSWSNASTSNPVSVSPSTTTSYTVVATDGNGCTGSAAALVTVNPGPSLSVSGNTLLCTGDAVTLTASGGVLYSWSTGGTAASVVVMPTSSVSYTVIGTSASGCTSALTVSVTVVSPPSAGISGSDTICLGSSVTLSATGGGMYLWNTGQTSASISVSPTSSTNYSVVVSAGTCSDTAFASVIVNPSPVANAGTSVGITQGQSAMLTATGGGNYSWSNGTIGSTNIVNPNSTTQYCVFVTNVSGCVDSSCVIVYVKPIDCSDGVYVPNAFSPNGDNENDFFQAYFVNISCVKYFKIMIYNRWGEKIFYTNDPGFQWDGSYPEFTQNSAVFTYYMYVRFTNGNEVSRKGNVSLVR